MSQQPSQIIISLSDYGKALKKGWVLILASGLILGFLMFTYQCRKSITYTAEGIFKGSASSESSGSLGKMMELFGGNDHYISSDDPKFYLRSYPVLKGIVKAMHLQGSVSGASENGRLKELWYLLKAERWNSKYVSKKIGRLKKSPFQELEHPPLMFEHLEFTGELVEPFKIKFLDDSRYQIINKNKECAESSLGSPFNFSEGSFTLKARNSSDSFAGKSFTLSLTPLDVAVSKLERVFSVKRDKDNPGLVNVTCTSRDRHFAANLVNTAMKQFQKYLQDEGSRKINKQLRYLDQRQEETLNNIDFCMHEQRKFFEAHIGAGDLFTLENEIEFLANQQAEERKKLKEVEIEIRKLSEELSRYPKQPSKIPGTIETLTLASSKKIQDDYLIRLDEIALEKRQCDYCIEKLDDPSFDCASVSKILKDPSLQSRYEKIQTLHRKLADSKNWTEKELQIAKGELETEKSFLIKMIASFKEGILLREEILLARLLTIKTELLSLLEEQKSIIERNLQNCLQQSARLPEIWMSEQKTKLNSKIYLEMMDSLTKLIETKNIGYHLECLNAIPFKKARAPLLPDHPKLALHFILGLIAGMGLCFLVICLKELSLGPTASLTNLKTLGYTAWDSQDRETIPSIAYTLSQKGPVTFIGSKEKIYALPLLMTQFSRRGETATLLDIAPFKDKLNELKKQVESLKAQSDRVILYSTVDPRGSFAQEVTHLADTTLFYLTNERFEELKDLPRETYFIVQPGERNELIPLPLGHIMPMLDRIFSSFFASASRTPL